MNKFYGTFTQINNFMLDRGGFIGYNVFSRDCKKFLRRKAMKKLSLVLALIFVFTCSVLAACGGDETTSNASSTATASSKVESKVESSEAVSSEAASSEAASSEAASSEVASSEAVSSEAASSEAASSEVASSEVESSEAESSEEESSEPDAPVVSENLAAGKEVSFVSGNGMHATYNGNVTDGKISEKMDDTAYTPGVWLGLGTPQKEGDYAYFVVDLGAYCKVTSAKVHMGIDAQAGVGKAWDCTFSYSEDGVNFVGGDEWTCPAQDGTHWIEKEIDSVFCRYIRVKCMPSAWAFFDEIEVYGEVIA